MSADTKGRLVGLVMAALLSPIWFLVAHFSDETRGFVVFCVAGIACAAAYVQRKKRNRVQLWVLIFLIYLVELPVSLFIPLPSRIPGSVMIPISCANLFLFLGPVALLQRFCDRRGATA